MKLYEIVKSTSPIGNIPKDTEGTIVHIHNGEKCMVEFFDKNGNTIDVVTTNNENLKSLV